MSDTKPTIRLHYLDFWKSFNPEKHIAVSLLSDEYNVVLDNTNPDIIFYSSFGWEHIYHNNALRVFYTGENEYPDFNTCDYALSHLREDIGGKNYYWPYCMSYIPTVSPIPENAAQRPFASFLASQVRMYGAKKRADFTRYLMEKYRHVDCPGRILHNVDIPDLEPRYGDWRASKISYVGRYKFSIAFENSNTDGYITEKLTDCFVANTVPIYWGSEGNVAPFPKEAMICANDYPDFDSLIARIKEVDENDELYMSILRANPLHQKEFMNELKQRQTGMMNFLKMIAREALNRNNPDGCISRRSIGNLFNAVDFFVEKEKPRILASIPKKDCDVEKTVQSLHAEEKAERENIKKLVQSLHAEVKEERGNIKKLVQSVQSTQKKLQENREWTVAVMQLPRFRRQFFRARLLSHLLPKYKGGVYVKEKRRLRNLIIQIEQYIQKIQLQ